VLNAEHTYTRVQDTTEHHTLVASLQEQLAQQKQKEEDFQNQVATLEGQVATLEGQVLEEQATENAVTIAEQEQRAAAVRSLEEFKQTSELEVTELQMRVSQLSATASHLAESNTDALAQLTKTSDALCKSQQEAQEAKQACTVMQRQLAARPSLPATLTSHESTEYSTGTRIAEQQAWMDHSMDARGKPPALSLDSSDRALSIERLRPLVEPKPKMSKEDYVRSFVERGLEARGRHLKGGVEGAYANSESSLADLNPASKSSSKRHGLGSLAPRRKRNGDSGS